jgi:glutaredoxin
MAGICQWEEKGVGAHHEKRGFGRCSRQGRPAFEGDSRKTGSIQAYTRHKFSFHASSCIPYLASSHVLLSVSAMKIKAYLKPHCGWSNGVRAIMRKHGLAFEDIDIINNRDNYAEMVAKSGQPLSPCVEIDGVMLADVSGEEVENYLLSNDLIRQVDKPVDVPTNAGCSDEEHAKMATKTIRFF